MTGKDIKRAYDSINPNQTEKERMLRSILDKAEIKQETGRRKEAVVYTAKPVKTSAKSLLPLLAACFAVLVLSGIFLFRLTGHPSDSLSTGPSAMEAVYGDVLQLYRRALNENWTPGMCTEKGISSRTPIANEYDGLYYSFSDLDGNGTEELILSQNLWDKGRTEFLDIYTLKDGNPFLLASDREFLRPMLYEGGIIMHAGAVQVNIDAKNFSGYYRMQGEIFVMEVVVFQDGDGLWYVMDEKTLTPQEITEEREGEIAAGYTPAKLVFHTLTGTEEPDSRTDSCNYDAVLAKYKTALEEGWTEEQCEIEDISTIFAAQEFAKANIGYHLLDLDGNGADELIIGDSQYIYDLYSMLEDGAPVHLASYEGNSYHFTLCHNNKIVLQFIGKEESEWTAFRLEGYQMVAEQMLVCENNDWSILSDDRKWNPIEQKSAFEIMDQYPEKKLELTYFVDIPDHLRGGNETAELYMLVLEKYKTALLEKWDMEQCWDNEICYMIAWLTETPDALGASLLDLDDDGIQELLIVNDSIIYDLYTLKDGQPVLVLSGGERNSYRLCEDNFIINHGSGSAFWSVFNAYMLRQGELVLVDSVISDYEADPDNPWFRSPNGLDPGETLTEKEANAIRESYVPITVSATPVQELN